MNGVAVVGEGLLFQKVKIFVCEEAILFQMERIVFVFFFPDTIRHLFVVKEATHLYVNAIG